MQLQGLRWESNSRPRKKIYTLAKYPYRIRLPLLIIQCKILFLIYPIYTFTGITTIHIYTRTRDTLSATAFMAQLTGRRTRFAGSRVRFSPKALELHFSQLVSVESLHTRRNILIVYLYYVEIHNYNYQIFKNEEKDKQSLSVGQKLHVTLNSFFTSIYIFNAYTVFHVSYINR